jgi:cell division protein ZapA (FtsZ GTPase activity inhibitor)
VSETVKVQIFDQTYHLRGELDQAQADALAQYVDAKMRAIAEGTRMVDTQRLAVLAAIHMADEVFSLRQRQKEVEGEIRDRAQRAVTILDRAIEKSA